MADGHERSMRGMWWPLVVPLVAVLLAGCSSGGRTLSSLTTTTASTPSSLASSAPSTTVGTASPTTAAPTTTVNPSHFGMLPVGATLPSDAECATHVRPSPEIRPGNAKFNQTKGHGAPSNLPSPLYARVTGNFTGTTDEIIQWVACKWGFDEDLVRAQAAKESYWTQTAIGDFGTDAQACVPGHPMNADGTNGKCPESVGMMQVRYPYWGWAFNNGLGDAVSSTAYNLDAAMAARRNCYEGNETWLNTVERGQDYKAGDVWGCVGLWYSGRWYTDAAKDYVADIQRYLKERLWQTRDFVTYAGS